MGCADGLSLWRRRARGLGGMKHVEVDMMCLVVTLQVEVASSASCNHDRMR